MSVATTPSPLPNGLGDVGSFADFGESAIAVVVIEEAGGPFEDARDAIVVAAQFVIAALEFVRAAVIDKVAEKKIEAAIVIVIEPDAAGGPAVVRLRRLFR